MGRRARIISLAVLALLVVLVLGGPLAVLLVVAFIGLMALGDNLAGRPASPLRRQEVLRRHLGPSRPPESLTAEPYDEQAWAREWVRSQDKS